MNNFDIYITGVGGQGIGLLSETITRAADYAGWRINGTDTHGLAQRGGMVNSFIRLGENAYSPLIMKGKADLVIGLEIHEALRGAIDYLKDNGSLVYYQVTWQPLPVRLGKEKPVTEADITNFCKQKNITIYSVFNESLSDARMQNMVILASVIKNNLIPCITKEHYLKALSDLMSENRLEKNKLLIESLI